MRMPTRLMALLVATPLVLAGCGGSGSSTGSAAPASASEANVALPTASPGQTVDKDAFVEASTKAQTNAKTVAMNMDIDVKTQKKTSKMKVTGVADTSQQSAPKMKMSMTIPGTSTPMEMILVNNSVYMKVPQAGDKWMQTSAEQLAQSTGQDLTTLMDPTKQLQRSKDAITKVTYVGEEDVAGVKTRHYSASMDSQKAMAAASQSLPASASLPATIPMDIWLDEKGLTRKIVTTMDMGNQTSMKMTGLMDKYGEPVTVEAPPASQVTSAPVPSAGKAAR